MSSRWTLLPHFCGERAYIDGKKLSLTLALSVLALSACGESTPRGYAGSPATEAGGETLKPVFAPPSANDSPPLPGMTGAQKTQDGLPAISAARGVNTNLFSTQLKDDAKRMDRLENAVQELRNDFDAISPAIVRLVAIEKDIQNLLSQLEVLTGNAPAPVPSVEEAQLDIPAPVQPAPIPAPPVSAPAEPPAQAEPMDLVPEAAEPVAAPVPETPPPTPPAATTPAPTAAAEPASAPAPAAVSAPAPAATPAYQITALRTGLHPGKARLVFDLSQVGEYTTDLDSNEKILLIEIPKGGWSADMQKSFAGHPLLSDYRIETLADGGTRVIFALKASTEILYSRMQKNADGTAKIIIDLKTP